MKSKKAFEITLNNTLGALLAIAVIVIFFIAIYQVYRAANSGDKNAQTTLDTITAKIEALKNDETTTIEIIKFNSPKSWSLISWNRDENRPDKCLFENCLCICPGTSIDSCQNEGYCRFFEKETIEAITIQNYTYIDTYDGQEVFRTNKIIPLKGISINSGEGQIIKTLQLTKKENKVSITIEESKEEYSNRIPTGGL